jgi:hypothetical protein
VLNAFAPTQVVWARSANEDSSAVSIAKAAGTKSATSVSYDENCERRGTALFVPVLFTLAVGEGDVAATIDDGVEAFGEVPADVTFPSELSGVAVLSEGWLAAAASDTGAEMPDSPDEWTISLDGSLETAELGVHGHSGGDVGAYWIGTLE